MPGDSTVYENGMVFRQGCYYFDGLSVSGWTSDTPSSMPSVASKTTPVSTPG